MPGVRRQGGVGSRVGWHGPVAQRGRVDVGVEPGGERRVGRLLHGARDHQLEQAVETRRGVINGRADSDSAARLPRATVGRRWAADSTSLPDEEGCVPRRTEGVTWRGGGMWTGGAHRGRGHGQKRQDPAHRAGKQGP